MKGLLAQHVMKAVSSAAFGPDAGLRVIADARADVQKSGKLDDAALAPCFHVRSFGNLSARSTNFSATPLLQYRLPVGGGPSSNI